MKKSVRISLVAVGVLLTGSLGLAQAQALHSVFLSMPSYSEEALTWCGAAAGQMILGGYPTSACTVLQADVAAEIALHKVEAVWDTDPKGLELAMESLCPPPGGGWSIRAYSDPGDLMFSVAYWMTSRQYPAPVVLNTLSHNDIAAHQEHWVAIKAIVTDADPTTNSSITLENVWFVDPAPSEFGAPPIPRFVSDTTWYGELQPVSKAGSSYNGQYVGLVEPPAVSGKAKFTKEVLLGRPIGPEKALAFARRWIDELRLARLEPYKVLGDGNPLPPVLVNREQGGYYLVPYAVEGSLAEAAVLVNAYTGDFQEAGAFPARELLSEAKAVEIARAAIGREARRVVAEPVALRSSGGAAKYYPSWKVRLDDRVVGVSQAGAATLDFTDELYTLRVPARSLRGIAGDAEQLFALDSGTGELLQIQRGSGGVLRRTALDLERPAGVAFDGQRLWVGDPAAKKIHAFDPLEGGVQSSIPLEFPEERGVGSLEALAWDGRYLWTAISAGYSSTLNRVDPSTGKIVGSYFADCDPRGLAADGDTVWTLCDRGAGRRAIVDQRTIAADEKAVWASRRLVKEAEGPSPSDLAFDGEFLWYVDSVDNRAVRFAPGVDDE